MEMKEMGLSLFISFSFSPTESPKTQQNLPQTLPGDPRERDGDSR